MACWIRSRWQRQSSFVQRPMCLLVCMCHVHFLLMCINISLLVFTQRRSIVKSVGCFQRRLCVCQHDNFRTNFARGNFPGLGTPITVQNWCTMTCTGWLLLSECSTSLLWQSIVVFSTELQGISPTTVCQSVKLLVASTCDLPDVINCQFCKFAAALLGTVHFLSPDQESGIHCLIICGIQLLTPNNLGETWRRICSLYGRSVSALEVSRYRPLQINIYLLTYLLARHSTRSISLFVMIIS